MVRDWNPARVARVLYVTGYIATVTSVSALVLGLLMVQVGASDLRATLEVSGEAMEAVVGTVDVLEDAVSDIRDSIDAAAEGVSGVSATATIGAESIEEVAVFLEQDLPTDLEAIHSAMPAAIQTAGAIDGALRALSFVGVSYSPGEPFDDSLRRVEAALADMPDDLRSQSESLRNLLPAATRLAGDAELLSGALTRLGNDLATLEGITQTYDQTLTDASATIDRTGSTLDRNLWLLRIALVAMAMAGFALGVGMITMSRFVNLNLSPNRVEVPEALTAGGEDH
jgi:hypothetical protein